MRILNDGYEIMRKYNIPKSTFYKMIKDYQANKNSLDGNTDIVSDNDIISIDIQFFIHKLIKPPTHQITINQIRSKIRETHGINIKKSNIVKFLKNSLNYVF